MPVASLVSALFALLALCVAGFNLWLFAQRPRERAHLWLAVAAAGVMWLASGSAAQYHATTLLEAQRAQRVATLSALPIVIGFLRFTTAFLKTRADRISRWVTLFALAFGLLPTLQPDLFFAHEAVERHIEPFGERYLQVVLTPVGALATLIFMPICGALLWLYIRHRDRIDGARPLAMAFGFWSLCAANDIFVFLGVLPAPHAMALGFSCFAVVFTGLLLHGFTAAAARVEASAEALAIEVEERTRQLREKDLELAHGARMATVGALATSLAHEINDPIAFVSSNMNQLARSWRSLDATSFDEIVCEAREGVERVRRVVSELLRLARRSAAPEGPVDLRQVVASILPLVQPEARWRARLETVLEPVPDVRGEERLLGQVVLNLVVNALRSLPEGHPERHTVRIETRVREGLVVLSVADDGPGIAPDALPHLFDPFALAHAGREGAELGLAVTHALVVRHRGRIDVETSSRGTRFVVELPPAPPGELADLGAAA